MKKKKKTMIVLFLIAIALFSITFFLPSHTHEDVGEMMKDAVLHEVNKVNLFGLEVNPGLIAAFIVSGVLILIAIILRIFVIPKFSIVPGKIQLALETLVGLFVNMGESNSKHRNKFLNVYLFVAATYIFIGTIFELFGIQAVTIEGSSISLPAPLSDINGAIALGCLSYLVIMAGGILANGFKGLGQTLKDFSLPISMSFRLFGALLSGALVTELVYSSINLSYGVPIIVAVLFTLIHALVQSYVLTTLVSIFYGEVTEKHEKKEKKVKKVKLQTEEI